MRCPEAAPLLVVAERSLLLQRPYSAEDLRRRAGHEDRRLSIRPIQNELAAGKMGQDAPPGPARQDAGDTDGTGPGAAGECNAGATFPGPHSDLARAEKIDDMRVYSPREHRVMFQGWAQDHQGKLLDIVHVDDGVRVSHGDR